MTTKYYLVTVHMIVNVEEDQAPQDGISALLSEAAGDFVNDWCYNRAADGTFPGPRRLRDFNPDTYEEGDIVDILWPQPDFKEQLRVSYYDAALAAKERDEFFPTYRDWLEERLVKQMEADQ